MAEIKQVEVDGVTYDLRDASAVKTVNGTEPDASGNVEIEAGGSGGGIPVVEVSSTDGVAYGSAETVDGITFTKGEKLVIVPSMAGTSNSAKLTINNKTYLIKCRVVGAANALTYTATFPTTNWLLSGIPLTLTFHNNVWIADEITITAPPMVAGVSTSGYQLGSVVYANASAVSSVATKQVRNIYAGTDDMTAGTTALATGDIYLVYE